MTVLNLAVKPKSSPQAIQWAIWLSWATIIYNVAEGVIAIFFGLQDETLALFGFGVDSFVEVISGMGILHLAYGLRENHTSENQVTFEKRALTITGTAFYLLAIGLVITAILNIIQGHEPQTTFWGLIISGISIVLMKILIDYKEAVGTFLNSDAIYADAQCARACMYFSIILLTSSFFYEVLGFGWIDSLGALGIAWLSFREGREAFFKVKTGNMACNCEH